MSKMKGYLGMAMMMAAMAGGPSIRSTFHETDVLHPEPLFKVIPKGCKEYFFNDKGEYSTDHMLKTECVFKCYALNDKSAIRKFKNRHKS